MVHRHHPADRRRRDSLAAPRLRLPARGDQNRQHHRPRHRRRRSPVARRPPPTLHRNRPQSKDRDLHHQERAAVERRITDRYTKAADQLGSDKAPVRLAGLYALERVAQNNEEQRQTIVNVLCAYLRMPYEPPAYPPPDDADTQLVTTHLERLQEREVRLTAQRLLADHLRPGNDPTNPLPTFWSNINLDLTGATLIDFRLADCSVHTASFQSATFNGRAYFRSATFSGRAGFAAASFAGYVTFSGTQFIGAADFINADFDGNADFDSAIFKIDASFARGGNGATFNRDASFAGAVFSDLADFQGVTFGGKVSFAAATFARGVPEKVRQYWSPPAQ